MTVREYVSLGRSPYHGLLHAPSDNDYRIVDSVFERLSLQEFAERDVVTLSGGERQRMVLARALAQSTSVIVLDEPITGLDLRHQMGLLNCSRPRLKSVVSRLWRPCTTSRWPANSPIACPARQGKGCP